MSTFLALSVVGLVTGCIYALTAAGLVVTYTTAGVFNFAQGAMGMVAAFGFWQLWQGWGLPVWLSLVLVVLVAAPLFGVLVERVLFRRTAGAPADQTLAVTLGLLLVLLGVANAVWPANGVKYFMTLFNAHEMANFTPQADQQSFRPVINAPLMYDQTFFKKLGGSAAAEGIYGSNGEALFFGEQDAAAIPSVATFQKWYGQVPGGAAADSFAADAWASMDLLVRALRKAGPRLTRGAVLSALRATTSFDADGFFAPSNPGQKKPGNCYVLWQIRAGKYVRVDSPATGYRCDGVPA